MRLTNKVVLQLWDERIKQKGVSSSTVYSYQKIVKGFLRYIAEIYSTRWDWRNLSREDGLEYLEHLRNKDWKHETKKQHFTVIKNLVRFLWRCGRLLSDPWESLNMKYIRSSTLRRFTQEEVERFLCAIAGDSFAEVLDRTMFEVAYSSALRPIEIRSLKREDVDLKNRLLVIRGSKFGKDRVVPLTSYAAKWLEHLFSLRKVEYIFGANGTKPMHASALNNRFRDWSMKAGIYKKGMGPHSMRHSCASHLLENGADIRYVQKLLGHETVETTVGYTNESTSGLKRWFRTHHPRENELYQEMDEEYRERLAVFKKRLERNHRRSRQKK
jgi:integrase/recombinase XerD